MTLDNENARPGRRSETGVKLADEAAASVTDPGTIARSRRRWRLHQRFTTARKISGALDIACGSEVHDLATVQIDYAAMGFTLGFEERRARGLAILERERAA